MTNIRIVVNEAGVDAYTSSVGTTFTIPALDGTQTQVFANTDWVSVGQNTFFSDGTNYGTFVVTNKVLTTLTLKNTSGHTQGTTIAIGGKLSPAGKDGVDGAPGADGADGAAATVAVGAVTTGSAGSSASVTNAGTSNAAVLDFTIPRGADGVAGLDGKLTGGYTLTPGQTTRTIQVGLAERRYILYVPTDYINKVVFAFHGGGSNPNSFITQTGLITKADAAKFIVVFPYGTPSTGNPEILLTWNAEFCCGLAMSNNVDDLSFVQAMKAELINLLGDGTARFFATGFSNGALLCEVLAQSDPSLFDAIASVAGVYKGIQSNDPSPTLPADPTITDAMHVNALLIHGVLDSNIPYAGGQQTESLGNTTPLHVPSFDTGFQFWQSVNKATSPVSIGSLSTEITTVTTKNNNYTVKAIVAQSCGHVWPGDPDQLVGVTSTPYTTYSATNEIWSFFNGLELAVNQQLPNAVGHEGEFFTVNSNGLGELRSIIPSDVVGLSALLSGKQATLVSGTNIKTINSESLLGSGDIVLTGAVSDGDKGDVIVSASGTVWNLDTTAVTPGSYTNANLTVDSKGRVTEVSSGVAGAGGHTIQNEGTPLTARTNLNFKGTAVTATDNSGADSTDVTINLPTTGSGLNLGTWDSAGTFTTGVRFDGSSDKVILPKATTTERTAITPLASELIYDTDLDQFFYGDGTTLGGKAVGSTTVADNVFRIQDNGDHTKQIAFEVSGITTGTTRTITPPDASGTIALIDTTGLSDKDLFYYDSASKLFKRIAIGTTDQVLTAKPSLDPPIQFTTVSTSGGSLLTSNRTYYVRTDGSDSNNGLTNTSGDAFLTIQKAVDTAATLDLNGYTLTIQVGDGTYTNPISLKEIKGYSAPGCLVLKGNTSTPANTIISTTSVNAISVNSINSIWDIKDLEIRTTTGGTGIRADEGTFRFDNIRFGSCAIAHIVLSGLSGGYCIGNYSIVGGAIYHFYVDGNSYLEIASKTITLTGTPAFLTSFIRCSAGAVANVPVNTFIGSATGTRYNIILNGVIDTGGGGANYFPGNSAGSAATGGQYN